MDKTKGEKWGALAELLGLDAINRLRLDLQRARNELEKRAQQARGELSRKRTALGQHVRAVSEREVLQAINTLCEEASVRIPKSLDEALSPQWLQSAVPEGSQESQAAALQVAVADLRTSAEEPVPLDAIEVWNQFVTQEKQDVLPLGLYHAADSLLKSGHAGVGLCPLCDQPVDLGALGVRVADSIQQLERASRALEAAKRAARRVGGSLRDTRSKRSDVVDRARECGVELTEPPESPHEELSRCVEAISKMELVDVSRYVRELDVWDKKALIVLEAAIPPPATERKRALVDLAALLAEATAWRDALRLHSEAKDAFNLADRVYRRYQERQLDDFHRVIQQISNRVAEIYEYLHPEGGISQVTVETVGEKAAELSINFHGRTESPPHRVLSESHLNSLGLALFLAMAETFNEEIGFLVLDDVVNSFDREHRGRLAELLVEKSEATQLIVLTHDEQFFTRICNLAPNWSRHEFTSWSYTEGPRTKGYEGDRLLEQACEAVSLGDRIGAAHKGRRALEEFLQDACEGLEALLPFRRGHLNDHRMADEAMKGLRRTLRDRAKAQYKKMEPLLRKLEADLQAGLNPEVHASQGTTANQEVRDALDRVDELRDHFTCEHCATRIWHGGTPEASRCRCGQSIFPPPKPS